MLPVLLLWLSIVINEFVPAPSSGSEWVELYNAGSSSVDLSNWVIDDDTPGGTRVVIASGTTLPPGGFLVVTIPSAILNNSGDTVTLSDASGATIDQLSYTSSTSNQAILRIPDGASTITSSDSQSPGNANAPAPSSSPTPTSTPEPSTATPMASATAESATATIEPDTTAVATPYVVTLIPSSPTPTMLASETPSKTPSPTKTETPSKTPSPTKTETPSKTPSPTKTASLTRTLSPTKTPSLTKTLSPSKTRSATKTLLPSKTPSVTRTPSETKAVPPAQTPTTPHMRVQRASSASHAWLQVALVNHTAVATICQRDAHPLAGWWLTVDNTAQEINVDQRCTTAMVPVDAHLSLTNPHHYPVATVNVADALCASDIALCRPITPTLPPATPRLMLMRSPITPAVATPFVASEPVEVPIIATAAPAPMRWPLLQIGAVCVLAGLLMLRTLAPAPSAVLYSETDADAASSTDPIAQRVEDGESSTNDQRERHR